MWRWLFWEIAFPVGSRDEVWIRERLDADEVWRTEGKDTGLLVRNAAEKIEADVLLARNRRGQPDAREKDLSEVLASVTFAAGM